MDLRYLTNAAHSPHSGSPSNTRHTQDAARSPSFAVGSRKRRAIGLGPQETDDAAHSRESMSQHHPHTREDVMAFDHHDHQEQARSPAASSWDAHIPRILIRLSQVEEELAMLKPPARRASSHSDMASMRSILSPAMQGSSDPRTQVPPSTHDDTTPIYSDHERQLGNNFMDSLSLRRDLLSPENPPFGMWWSYTVEETLVWPILEFRGQINGGLDAVLDLPDEDESDSEAEQESLRESSSRKGLDDSDTVYELIGKFLGNVHVQNPLLDPTQLQGHVIDLIENGLGWDGKTCQVLLACALGAVSSPWNESDLHDFSGPVVHSEQYSVGQAYFNAAQKRLGALWSRSSLISAQCLFMTGIYFMYTQQPVSGWRAFNMATIACRSYISKRVAAQNKAAPRPDSRSLEQRLCWSCMKAEREIACEFGMETSGLNLLAYSTTLPTPPSGFGPEISNISPISPFSQIPQPEDQSGYYYLTEIMLRKLQMRIDIFYQDKRREAYRRAGESAERFFRSMVEALKEFDFQLTRYYESLPSTMDFSLDDLTPCSDKLRHFLRWRLFCVRHDITLPALFILLHNNVSSWSREIIAELVQLANACLLLDVKILRTAITTFRHQSMWTCMRTGVRSALVLIAAERLAAKRLPGLERLCVPDRITWEDGAHALMEGLRYWSRESRDCAAYVETLRQLHPAFRDSGRRTL